MALSVLPLSFLRQILACVHHAPSKPHTCSFPNTPCTSLTQVLSAESRVLFPARLVGELLFNLQGPSQMPVLTKFQSIRTLPEDSHVFTFQWAGINSFTAKCSTPDDTEAQPGRNCWMGGAAFGRAPLTALFMPNTLSKEAGGTPSDSIRVSSTSLIRLPECLAHCIVVAATC